MGSCRWRPRKLQLRSSPRRTVVGVRGEAPSGCVRRIGDLPHSGGQCCAVTPRPLGVRAARPTSSSVPRPAPAQTSLRLLPGSAGCDPRLALSPLRWLHLPAGTYGRGPSAAASPRESPPMPAGYLARAPTTQRGVSPPLLKQDQSAPSPARPL